MNDLHTSLVEGQCRANNRPLSYVTNDLGDPKALTPSLLHGFRLNSLPPESTSEVELNSFYLDAGK